ncbi:MAG: hypothetical protein K0R39_2140 [Symbiobacteriaceae bacterium]|jgi:hypothetical protein|nr:hypothetical protein [Symbiobacteriaceae bacterium]
MAQDATFYLLFVAVLAVSFYFAARGYRRERREGWRRLSMQQLLRRRPRSVSPPPEIEQRLLAEYGGLPSYPDPKLMNAEFYFRQDRAGTYRLCTLILGASTDDALLERFERKLARQGWMLTLPAPGVRRFDKGDCCFTCQVKHPNEMEWELWLNP